MLAGIPWRHTFFLVHYSDVWHRDEFVRLPNYVESRYAFTFILFCFLHRMQYGYIVSLNRFRLIHALLFYCSFTHSLSKPWEGVDNLRSPGKSRRRSFSSRVRLAKFARERFVRVRAWAACFVFYRRAFSLLESGVFDVRCREVSSMRSWTAKHWTTSRGSDRFIRSKSECLFF